MKTILAILAFFFASTVFAQSTQCRHISGADQRSKCYKNIVADEEIAQKRSFLEIKRLATPARYQEMQRDQRVWSMNINNACAIDNVCKAVSYRDRSIYLRETIKAIKRKA